MSSATERRRGYHHGDLRSALVTHGVALLGEVGVAGFSVAALAKRVGVSAAAPYRHFPDRHALLAACASVVARELADRLSTAATDPDPEQAFGAVAGAHARFVVEHGVGLDLIFAAGFDDPGFAALHEQARRVVDVQMAVAGAAVGFGAVGFGALAELVQAQAALAHGYATLLRTGGFAQLGQGVDEVERLAAGAARSLVRGYVAANR